MSQFVTCPICGTEIRVFGKQKRTYCSRACLSAGYRTRMQGSNNPNYRHGPIFCVGCGKELCKNAKGERCFKCIDRNGEKNSFYGKHHTEEQKEIWRESRKDLVPVYAGAIHSPETLEKISAALKKSWRLITEEERKNRLSKLRQLTASQLNKKGHTVPEEKVAKALDELGIPYRRNASLYDKFFVDFLLDDGKIIEVFGDYWHGNESVFKNLNEQQLRQRKKDKSRLAYLEKCGHRCVVIWEMTTKLDNLTEILKEELA